MSAHYWKMAFYPINTIQDKLLNLKTLRIIYDNISTFFPEEAYSIKKTKDQLKLNWLQNYLYIPDPRFLGYARELAVIINYYDSSAHELQKLNIKPKDKNISRLRDRFFELFINFVLENNGLNSSPNESYRYESIEKPLDSYFECNGKNYLIECAKLYDIKQSVLLKTVTKVIRKVFVVKGKMVIMQLHMQPSGYILFKSTKNINLTEYQIENSFNEVFNQYLANMNSKDEVIQPYAIIENDIYKIFVGSNLFFKFSESDKQFKGSDLLIFFQCDIKYNNIQIATFNINAIQKRNTQEEYKIIIGKIKFKKEQHKNADGLHLIIFLEFEQGISVNEEERPLDIDFKHLNFDRFTGYVDEKTSLFFLSKRYNNMQAYYETKFLHHEACDLELSHKLNHLKFPAWLN
jgi:hypothetical protein